MHREVQTDLTTQQITLRDGRKLGFAEYGDPEGAPVLYFHGWPGSRVEAQAAEVAGVKLKARVLALDRPGYGLSDYRENRSMLDWAADVLQFADQAKLERFSVLGMSGGAPYVAVCAARIPERISRAVMLCGVGPTDFPGATRGMVPLNRWMLYAARTAPSVARFLVGFGLERMKNDPEAFLPPAIESRLAENDRKAIAVPGFRKALMDSFREAFRPGVEGTIWDGSLYARPWGFRLEEIRIPVELWHGEADVIVPPAMGHHMADRIPNCRARFCPGEGHFSLPLKYLPEIIGGKAS